MNIIYGISGGMVMQRRENECDIQFRLTHAGEVKATFGQIEALGDGLFRLTGIPTGGPYTLTLTDDESAVEIENFYVGDVWVLAGQSNMEGAGARRPQDIEYDRHPDERIRAYTFSDRWTAARSLLHEQWLNSDTGVREKYLLDNKGFTDLYGDFRPGEPASGVGPGLYIGREMYALTRIPQGLIPCAYGGSCMLDWSPDNHTPASLYQSMLRRIRDCGGRVKGVFWYQGEAETNPTGLSKYDENMRILVSAIRNDVNDSALPFVQAQLFITSLPQFANEAAADYWHKIRILQWALKNKIPALSTVSTANAFLQDLIHIDAESHEQLGKTMAQEMRRLLTGEGMPPPELETITVQPHPLKKSFLCLRLKFKNVCGSLISIGRPYGVSVTLDDETSYQHPYRAITNLRLEKDSIIITIEPAFTPPERVKVWYAAGFNTVCTITDELGRALPAFGPVSVL